MRLLVLSMATALLVGACGGGEDASSPSSPERTAQTPPAPASPAPASPTATSAGTATAAPGDLDAAGAAALKAVPDSTLISIETEGNGWEVQTVTSDGTEHELLVSADGSSIIRNDTKQEDAEDKAKHQERVKAAKLDYRQAAQKMRSAVPNAQITELNLDTWRGTTVWEGDMYTSDGTKHSVKIDAASGEVLMQ